MTLNQNNTARYQSLDLEADHNLAIIGHSSTSEVIKPYDRKDLQKEFFGNHTTKFFMNATYPIQCVTLDRTQGTQMVVLMHHVKAKATHMEYVEYKHRSSVKGDLTTNQNEQKHTRSLALFERSDTEAPLMQKSSRVLDGDYKWAVTTFSSKKNMLAIPRFSCKESLTEEVAKSTISIDDIDDAESNIIDIYDCSSEFWNKNKVKISKRTDRLKHSLELDQDKGRFVSMQFSPDDDQVCVLM